MRFSKIITFTTLNRYEDLLPSLPKSKNLESSLEQALKEAVDDATLRKIKRISYSANAATELSEVLPMVSSSGNNGPSTAKRSSKDLELLDKLVTTLLEKKSASETSSPSSSQQSTLQRLRPLSRSLSRSLRLGSFKRNNNSALPTIAESGGSGRRSDHSNVKTVINTIRNAPQRFSTANDEREENKKLTQNILE